MSNLGIAIYSYKGPERLECLLQSIKYLGHTNPIVVAEDRSDDAMAAQYARVCAEFGARHVRLEEHGHMSATNHRAVMECTTPWVLVCSDDVMIPRGLIPALERFLEYNVDHPGRLVREFMSRVAGIYLHHWDRSDIIAMAARGDITELPDFQDKDFFAGQGEWFWKHLDGKLPYGGWSEPTPPDKLAINCAVHGSAFVVNRACFEMVGGCIGIDCWQNDSVISDRINNFSDSFIVRLPWLPSVPHRGGAAETPPDPKHRWDGSIENLCLEHGFAYGNMPKLFYDTGELVAPIAVLELGWRARAMALNKRYESVINGLDYGYRDECEQL